MDEQATTELLKRCASVLKHNDRNTYTVPAAGLYPHQWLWDSCFIAIGLRHADPKRAKTEILSLLKGQWSNGMLPHTIFSPAHKNKSGETYSVFRSLTRKRDADFWQSWLNPYAPPNTATSGITQPPMVAEAVWRIGETLKKNDRVQFFKAVLPALIRYHEWLYYDRDPHQEGLTLQIHPWETGMDNTPPWMMQLRQHSMPIWVWLIERLRLDKLVSLFRRDVHFVPVEQRESTIEALLLSDVQRRLRRKRYDIGMVLHRSLFTIEDLTFNSILVRANTRLRDIAKTARYKLPAELLAAMKQTEQALEQLWDEGTAQYYSRDFVTHQLLPEQTIATFMPLYAGTISQERAQKLVKLLKDYKKYWLQFPVPSVPMHSPFFNPDCYWQGPTWINMNWLIIDGLERYGFTKEAADLRQKTIEVVAKNDVYEYYSPLDGTGRGTPGLSWTAALIIDLIVRR